MICSIKYDYLQKASTKGSFFWQIFLAVKNNHKCRVSSVKTQRTKRSRHAPSLARHHPPSPAIRHHPPSPIYHLSPTHIKRSDHKKIFIRTRPSKPISIKFSPTTRRHGKRLIKQSKWQQPSLLGFAPIADDTTTRQLRTRLEYFS